MSDFDTSFKVLMHFEGSDFEDHPDDPGGPTKFGITLPFLREFYDTQRGGKVATIEDIKALTFEETRIIYQALIWDRYNYTEITDTATATALFLAAVHLGPWRAHRALQRALRAAGQQVLVDGYLGPITRAAVAASEGDVLAAAYRATVAGRYDFLVARHPYKGRQLAGWRNRAYWPY